MSQSNQAKDKFSRRKLLQAGSAGVAAALLPSTLSAGPVEAPIHWHHETDVLVCGSGAAGSMAALTASRAGADVTLIEKAAVWGGTSRKSGFHIWIPNNKEMATVGTVDNKTDCLQYMAQQSYPHLFDANSDTLGLPAQLYKMLETYYEEGSTTVEKLADWDVLEFRVGRIGDQQIAAIDYNDNSPYNKAIVGRSLGPIERNGRPTYGRYATAELRRQLRKHGVKIHMRHRANKLLLNSKGEVIGLTATRRNGQPVNIRARRGVVFGTGCYTANKQYLAQFQMMPLMGGCGAASNEGDFIAIGGAAGAQMGNLSGAWRAQLILEDSVDLVSAPTTIMWPIGDSMFLVNKYGKRFVNEKRNYNDRTKGVYRYDANLCEFPDVINFMIYDQRTTDLYAGFYPIPHSPEGPKYVISGNTLDELADNIKTRLQEMAAHTGNLELGDTFNANLQKTFDRFNSMAKKGVDEDFQRGDFEYDKAWHKMIDTNKGTGWKKHYEHDNVTLYPLQEQGPYYAIILLPGCLGTNGGPVINEKAQVLDYSNQPIGGLYGAGNCIASPAANAYWGGGTTIGSALIFGRLAGESVAAEPIKEIV